MNWNPMTRTSDTLPDLQPGEYEVQLKNGQTAQLKFITLRELPTADVSCQVVSWRQLNKASRGLFAVKSFDHRPGAWGAV